MVGEIEPEPVGVLGEQLGEHPLEVEQRARREVVAGGGLQVDPVESWQIGNTAERDHDPGFVGLLDVAAPELVHPGQQVGLTPAGQGDLEHELRLSSGKSIGRSEVAVAEALQLGGQA